MNIQFFLDDKIHLYSLMCREVTDRHFANNIVQWTKDGIHLFEIEPSSILAIAIDSARNVTRAIDDFAVEVTKMNDNHESADQENFDTESFNNDPLEVITFDEEYIDIFQEEEHDNSFQNIEDELLDSLTRIHCIVHKLQLGVNDYLKSSATQKTIKIAQKIAAKLRCPVIKMHLTNMGLHQAIMCQATRWNTTHEMLKRLLELKIFLVKTTRNFINHWQFLVQFGKTFKTHLQLFIRLLC